MTEKRTREQAQATVQKWTCKAIDALEQPSVSRALELMPQHIRSEYRDALEFLEILRQWLSGGGHTHPGTARWGRTA